MNMKKFIVRWIIPYALPILIDVLRDLASRTDNTIDDAAVESIASNSDKIIEGVKHY